MVSSDHLIYKLGKYRMEGTSKDLIENYLYRRSQSFYKLPIWG